MTEVDVISAVEAVGQVLLCPPQCNLSQRDLLAVTTLHRTESFQVAARELFVSRSSLTRHIASLEHSIGSRLFYRRSGSGAVRPTPAGTTFLRWAPLILLAMGALESDVVAAARSDRSLD
jgi:DNA-binding transcriptional LysR family regulator